MKKKEKTIYGLIGSILLLVLIVSTSYSYIKLNKEEKETNILGTDCIKLEMEEESEAITLHHAYPVTDEIGQASTPYTFRLTNQCGVGVDYEIHLRVEDGSTIVAKNIATSVDGATKVVLETQVETPSEEGKEEYKINNGELTLKPYETIEHKVRIWLDSSAGNDSQNGTFKSKVVIEAVQNQVAIYKEEILNGADPVLYDTTKEPLAMSTTSDGEPTITDTLVPIKIDEKDGTVTKADVTTEWYKYEDKKWANAVILVDNEKAKSLKAGETIQEEDIESYFVWIPKYRYKIFDMGNTYTTVQENSESYTNKAKAIEIEFGLENTKDDKEHNECATPNKSGDDGNCQKGYWMTHPAFTAFENSKGFWVGKFETGYNQDETNSTTIDIANWNQVGAQKDEIDSTRVIIKPNVYSWRNITVGNAYHTSYEYQRDLDSHMMKNTEWGAVAYLSHSKYGTCDENSCKEVRINNSSNFVTGVAGKLIPTTGYDEYKDYGTINPGEDASESNNFKGAYNYKSKESTLASTTGNYNGIYDMSGGAWEYVMGYMSGYPLNSGLTEDNDLTKLNSKYFDKYMNQISNDWNKRILGDATGELGPFFRKKYGTNLNNISSWYEDISFYLTSSYPWFLRGGAYIDGIKIGIFASYYHTGSTHSHYSFRIVLTPTNEAM